MNESYKRITEEYTVWLETLGFSNGVVYDYKYRIRDFFEWLQVQGISQINRLTQKQVEQYFEHLKTRPNKRRKGALLSVSHLNHNFLAVDKLLEFLHQQGAKNTPIPTNYRITPDKQERIYKIETLTQSEIKELYNSIENTYPKLHFIQREAKHYQLKLIFALYYGCGLRRSEGYRLKLDDIDFDKKTVFVEQGKNYKDRVIPMGQNVYKELQDYVYNFRHRLKLPHKRLFIYESNDYSKCLKELQTVCENEQIKAKRITLHVLRHSIATHLLQNGMSIENISLFLGHSTLDSTQIYTHIVNNQEQ